MKPMQTRYIVFFVIAGIAASLPLIAVNMFGMYRPAFGSSEPGKVKLRNGGNICFSDGGLIYESPPVLYSSDGYDQVEPLLSQLQSAPGRMRYFIVRPVGESCGIAIRKNGEDFEADLKSDGVSGRLDYQSIVDVAIDLGLRPSVVMTLDSKNKEIDLPHVTVGFSKETSEVVSDIQLFLERVYRINRGDPLEIVTASPVSLNVWR